MSPLGASVSLREMIDNLTDDMEVKIFDLQIMPCLIADTATHRQETQKRCEVTKNFDVNVAALIRSYKNVWV